MITNPKALLYYVVFAQLIWLAWYIRSTGNDINTYTNENQKKRGYVPCGTPMCPLWLFSPQPYEEKVQLEISDQWQGLVKGI